MKLNSILITLLITAVSYSQTLLPGSNTLTVKNTNTAQQNYNHAARVLINNGLFIETKDSDFFTLKTETMLVLGQNNLYYVFYVSCHENKIVLKGFYKPSYQTGHTRIENSKGKNGNKQPQISFSKLNEIAYKLGQNIEYSTTN